MMGVLLYSKPNQYTKPSPQAHHIHTISFPFQFEGISQAESFAVGTQCGTSEFQQSRVDEYLSYKKGQVNMIDILLKNGIIMYRGEVNEINWRGYYNLQYKRWFGNDLMDMF
jgi:hypothetical protein